MLKLSSNILQQVEKFKYLVMVFTSDVWQNNVIYTTIGKANKVLRVHYGSAVEKRELLETTKLSVFRSAFVPIFAYGRESWVMNDLKSVISSTSGKDRIFAKRTFCYKMCGCEIGKALNVKPLVPTERSQSPLFTCPECPTKDWCVDLCCLHRRETGAEADQRPGDVITSQTFLGGVWLWGQWSYRKLLKTVTYFEVS